MQANAGVIDTWLPGARVSRTTMQQKGAIAIACAHAAPVTMRMAHSVRAVLLLSYICDAVALR